MAFGFEATNNDGKVTISSAMPLVEFVGKCVNQGEVPGQYDVMLNNVANVTQFATPYIASGRTPYFFVYYPIGCLVVHIKSVNVGGGVWILQVVCSGGTPEVYCFATKQRAESGETHGLRVRDADGSLIFDSGWQANSLLRIKEVYNYNPGYTLTTTSAKPAFFYHNAGKSMAFIGTPFDPEYLLFGFGLRRTAANSYVREAAYLARVYADGPGTIEIPDNTTQTISIIDGADYD